MDETTNEVTREDEELVSNILDEFDSDSWDDDDADFDLSEEGSEADDGPIDGDEPDGEEEGQPEADEDESGEVEADDQTEKPGKEAETGNQRFRINYLGNEEEYDLAQMTELAQKGRNYDHVVEERDRLKGEVGKGKHDDFLEELARRAGLSVEEQIDRTRAIWLMNDEFDKGNEISEADALQRIQREKTTQSEPKEQKAAEPTNEDKTNQMIDRFLAVYPDVKATDIPREVWDSARQTGDLLGAYQALEIRRLRTENEKIRQDARNEQNARRSTGPRKSSGSTKEKDDFDAAWDSEY